MKLLFLGTGAADWPLQKPEGTDEFRRMSSVLIDDTLLIDPGPGVLDALTEYGCDLSKIRYIINTHSHEDHFNANTLTTLLQTGAAFHLLKDGDIIFLPPYTITAHKANHATCEDAVHFLIDDGGKRVFYGLDGAWLLYEEVKAIKQKPVDYAILDATIGDIEGDFRIFEHNNLRMVLEMKATLKSHIRRFCISHMAMTLHTSHAELAARMAKEGVETAYDGYEVMI